MKKILLNMCLLLPITLTGCVVCSLNPLFSEKTTITDERIVGDWKPYDKIFEKYDESTKWTIKKSSGKEYALKLKSDKVTSFYKLRLVKLGTQKYFDIIQLTDSEGFPKNLNTIPIHLFIRVIIKNNRIYQLMQIDQSRFKLLAVKHGLAFSEVEGRVVLTASTSELQEFYKKYGDQLFSEESMKSLVRQK